jgi:hypothetical protein
MPTALARELTFLVAERTRNYRPLQFRQIVPLKTGIPEWAESLEIIKVTEQASEPVPHAMGNQKAPTPSFDRSAGYLKLFEFALAYQVFDAEITRAEKMGVNVSAKKVLANARANEEFMDKIALIGDSRYGMVGLFRAADVTPMTMSTALSDLTDEEIVKVFGNLAYKVQNDTKQTNKCSRLVLPDNTERYLATRFTDGSSLSTLAKIQDALKGVDVIGSYKARTAGGTLTNGIGDRHRCVALDFSNDVVEMPIAKELTDGDPLKIHGGVEVLQTSRFGAPIVYNPAAIQFLDLANDPTGSTEDLIDVAL